MAFPLVQDDDTTTGFRSSETTSHPITLPANLGVEDRLLIGLVVQGAPTISGWPSGFNVIGTQATTASSDTIIVAEKIVSGTEANFTLTTSVATQSTYHAYRITGAHPSTPSEAAGVVGSATDVDFPSLNPAGWGTEDALWMIFAASDNGQRTVATWPASYTGGQRRTGTGSGVLGNSLASAWRTSAAASENPGILSYNLGPGTGGMVVGLRPAPLRASTTREVRYDVSAPPAFPIMAGSASSLQGTATTTHTVPAASLPSGAVGDIILCLMVLNGAPSVTLPDGYSSLVSDTQGGTNMTGLAFFKRATSTSEANVNVTTALGDSPGAQRSACRVIRITNTSATAIPQIASTVTDTTTSPNPPAITPTWGQADSMFVAVCWVANGATSITGYPANHTSLAPEVSSGGTSDGAVLGASYRQLNTVISDPSAFTINTSRAWLANNIAIAPVAVAPTQNASASRQVRYNTSSRVPLSRTLTYNVAAPSGACPQNLTFDQATAITFDQLALCTFDAVGVVAPALLAGASRALSYNVAAPVVVPICPPNLTLAEALSIPVTLTSISSCTLSDISGAPTQRASTTRTLLFNVALATGLILAASSRPVSYNVYLTRPQTRQIIFNVSEPPALVSLEQESIGARLTEAQAEIAMLRGDLGQITYRYRMFKSDKFGERFDELVGAVESASFSLDNFRDHTWELSLPMDIVENFDIWGDWVRLDVEISALSYSVVRPFGHYFFMERGGQDAPHRRSWELTGRSAEARLMGSTAHAGYSAGAGSGVLANVLSILEDQDVPRERIMLPPQEQDVALGTTLFFDPFQSTTDTRWLRIVNLILAAGGFLALFADNEGRLNTRKVNTSNRIESAFTYGTNGSSDHMIVSEKMPWKIDDENFANRVVVYSGDPAEAASYGVAENHDPNSRVSYERLGYWKQADPIELPSLVSPQEAQMVALQALRAASGINMTRTFETNFDTRVKPRQAYGLEVFDDEGGTIASGNIWTVLGVSASLDLSPMQHEVMHAVSIEEV